ncbi:MAG: hypothetical protein PHS32_15780, partial [Rhodoferax sp.]|uniref:hypothetical protein n=1 Tax=Rhodoferax sp. TaxID=50421 RepID=UPI0026205366
ELGNRLQTPTLIGCMFLKIQSTPLDFRLASLPLFTVISEALNYAMLFKHLSNRWLFFLTKQPKPLDPLA